MSKVQSKDAFLYDLNGDTGQLKIALREAMELGSAADEDATTFATAGQGAKADSAIQPTNLVTTSVNGLMLAADKVKLDGVAAGATLNATDAALRDRSSHTGEQAMATITGLIAALAAKATPADISAAITSLVGSSPAALDTLNELAAALGNDPSFATTTATALGNRVRFDAAQSRSDSEKLQARSNIDAASGAQGAKADSALQAPDYYYPVAQLGLPVARARPDAPTVYDWDWTAVINDALVAGKSVLLPEGVTGVTGLTVIDMSRIKGVHHRRSILKLLNGSNKHIISTANFDAQFGTVVTTVVPQGQVLRNFTIDGNRANNNIIAANGVVANGIALYARKMSIVNVSGYNIPGHFIACDYRDNASGSIAPGENGMLGMEGEFRNLWGDFIGGHGMWMYGPHDSFLANCHMLHCSLNANNTYDDFHFELSFSARGYNLHGYNSGLYNNHRYGIYDAAGCDIDASHFEGSATANVYIKGQRGVYTSIRAYSTRGALYNVIIGGNQNNFSGYLGGAASGSCAGVRFGLDGNDYSAGNVVDVIAVDQNSGTVDFTYSQGTNEISVSGTQASGSVYVGTPAVSDVLDMLVNGIWYRQQGNASGNNITAGGTSSSDATALTARANRITAVSGNAGVKLPSSLMLVGETIFIINSTSSTIKVYATGSDSIEYPGNSFPAPFTLAAGKSASFTACFRGQFGAIVSA
ncbi:hypothetical protein FS799_00675 [Agrobacterium vitis]|uniref:hypothetical protein n=1 Tax=Agrobacterium vitis TaxID=373 RepID=UPI001F1C7219|nr:hypothetical protein [Agrobacterium vitis]MCE6073370.1 hypothetical protein [Agrobacterium vitis]